MAKYYIQKKTKGFEVTDNNGVAKSKKLFKTQDDANAFIEGINKPKETKKPVKDESK
ncbi:MAG: hypothetical protein GY822_27480 [Deltaproteobacteria bacterium]|nr:hypothetical protein [Deltaproteobacteria bacterium]